MRSKIFTVGCIKGGTAKTASSVSLASAAVHDGMQVLLIDLDPQASSSIWLDADLTAPGSYDLLTGSAAVEQTIQHTAHGIDLIAGGADLAAVQTAHGSAQRLATALKPISGRYNVTLIDTSPSMGELQNNALYASTDLLIPLTANSLSLQGLYQIEEIAEHIRETHELRARAFITQFDGRPNINKFMRDTIKQKAEEMQIPYLMEIRRGVAVSEAEAMQIPLFDYAPKSRPAEDYWNLYEMIKPIFGVDFE